MNKFLRMRDESLFRGSHGFSRGTKVGSIFAHREEGGGSKENLCQQVRIIKIIITEPYGKEIR